MLKRAEEAEAEPGACQKLIVKSKETQHQDEQATVCD
jgi:hypothetical protein